VLCNVPGTDCGGDERRGGADTDAALEMIAETGAGAGAGADTGAGAGVGDDGGDGESQRGSTIPVIP
jgi:hypothetical protein